MYHRCRPHTAAQSRKAVTAYFSNEHLLPVGLVGHCKCLDLRIPWKRRMMGQNIWEVIAQHGSEWFSSSVRTIQESKNKWNQSGFKPLLCTNRLNWARRTSWGWWDEMRWHCPPDTGYEIQTQEVWGRARCLPVTEASHNNEFYEWMGKKHFEMNPELAWKAAVLITTLGPPPIQESMVKR